MTRTNIPSLNDAPSILLVHGALTDASVWNEVTRRLQAGGHTVSAPALAMRSLDKDAAYVAGVLGRIPGPVVLVGHSYAGAVISHPAIAACDNVKALVFIAAFQPDAGEAAGELNEKFPGSLLTPDNLNVVPNPNGGQDLTLRPERFAEVYAADVDRAHAAVMAASQRPVEPGVLGQQLPGEPAWRTLPSWALVSTSDRSLPPAILRFMAERAGSHVVKVDSSHAAPVSQPAAVTDLILQAVNTSASADAISH
ncbi:alpha/beta fold hydrolase [Streptomyces sp. CA-111067]|uniref:alpha/beta fold hydrolase n=1 Tax=Streptomyces sp. CA-111067 TaxID=3240046 RepID=UPI003D9778FA